MAALTLGGGVSYAYAQDLPPVGDNVLDRTHPEYDAQGIRVGAFILSPSLDVSTMYSDNIFATDTARRGDTNVVISPSLSLSSNWNRNSIAFSAGLDRSLYLRTSSQNTTDYSLGASAHVDASSWLALSGIAEHKKLTESRLFSDAARSVDLPSNYNVNHFNVGAVVKSSSASLQLSADRQNMTYDAISGDPNATLFNRARASQVTTYSARANFGVSPHAAAFVSFAHNTDNHSHDVPGFTPRDSDGDKVLVGAKFDLSHLMRGDVGVGYLQQRVHGAGRTQGLAVSGDVSWFPTQLTAITVKADRSYQDSTVVGSSGVKQTDTSVKIVHELLRNLLLNAHAAYSGARYVDLDRRDVVLSAGVGATYNLRRDVAVNLNYDHYGQTSRGQNRGAQYRANEVTVGITLSR